MKVTMNLSFNLKKSLTPTEKKALKKILELCVSSGVSDSEYKVSKVKITNIRNLLSEHEAKVLGGKNRALALSRSERSVIASNAARARWSKVEG